MINPPKNLKIKKITYRVSHKNVHLDKHINKNFFETAGRFKPTVAYFAI